MSEHTKKIAFGAFIAIAIATGLALGAMSIALRLGPTQTQSSVGNGLLNIYLTDAPPSSPQFRYLLLNVSSVVLRYEGNISGSGPENQFVYNVPSNVGTNVNLTSLVGKSVLLGTTKVPAGNITAIIFNITGAKAFFSDNSSSQLKVVANGKLMIPIQFQVTSTGSSDLTIDITPDSIHISNGHGGVLTPVVHLKVAQHDQDTTTTIEAATTISDTEETSSQTTSSNTTSA